jgi:hypothetical protein
MDKNKGSEVAQLQALLKTIALQASIAQQLIPANLS